MHLNPVRIGGLGLSKSDQRRARIVGCPNSGRELVERRLRVLEEFRWSSWRVYGGAEAAPGWLETGVIGRACGGRSHADRKAALRVYTEGPIRQGKLESPWAGLVGGLVLGDAESARRVLDGCKVNEEEQTEARRMRRRVSWEEVVQAAEKLRRSRWEDWADRHGDWGRDGAMHVAVRYGGLRLTEVMRAVEGLRYQAAAQAVKRFSAELGQDAALRKFVSQLRRHLSLI